MGRDPFSIDEVGITPGHLAPDNRGKKGGSKQKVSLNYVNRKGVRGDEMSTATRALLRKAIEKAAGTSVEAARRVHCDKSTVSKIFAGTRPIPPDLSTELAGMHPLAGLAIAREVTGYRLFSYIDGDRHPQTMIQRSIKEGKEADRFLEELPVMLIDKAGPQDLTEEERVFLFRSGKELCEEITAKINLAIELEDRYQLGILSYLTGEDKPVSIPRIT